MKTPILSVTRLNKRIGDHWIVKDVSFDVYPGEIFGFLGPNGAGKTTTIRMLVGLVRPTSGRIVMNGHNLRSHPNHALHQVGCVVENPDLYGYLSGFENLRQLARMQGNGALERIDHVVSMVQLTDHIHQPVRTYSLGMKQRLGIAQALLSDPKLLILDEPTNGLDPSGIRDLRTFLRTLAKDGLAVFVSSHLLAEIEQLCDRAAILRQGSVVQVGRVRDWLQDATPTVRWDVHGQEAAVSLLSAFCDDGSPTIDGEYIRCRMSADSIPNAQAALLSAGVQVYEIVRDRKNLEEVFLSATGGEDHPEIFMVDRQ